MSPMHLNGEKWENVILWQKTCWERANGQNCNVYENMLAAGGCLPLPRAKYMYIIAIFKRLLL